MPKSKINKLLLENSRAADTPGQSGTGATGTGLSKFGLDQLVNIAHYLKERVAQFDPSQLDYDPLFEIAKIALLTEDEKLAFACHSELARYQYPQIRSLEVQAKEDKEVRIKVELAGYAQPEPGHTGPQQILDIEDIESEGDLVAEDPSDEDIIEEIQDSGQGAKLPGHTNRSDRAKDIEPRTDNKQPGTTAPGTTAPGTTAPGTTAIDKTKHSTTNLAKATGQWTHSTDQQATGHMAETTGQSATSPGSTGIGSGQKGTKPNYLDNVLTQSMKKGRGL